MRKLIFFCIVLVFTSGCFTSGIVKRIIDIPSGVNEELDFHHKLGIVTKVVYHIQGQGAVVWFKGESEPMFFATYQKPMHFHEGQENSIIYISLPNRVPKILFIGGQHIIFNNAVISIERGR